MRIDVCRLDHGGHDVWLGNCLVFGNGKGAVLVSEFFKPRADESFPWHLPHRRQDGRIADTSACNLQVDHASAGFAVIHQGVSYTPTSSVSARTWLRAAFLMVLGSGLPDSPRDAVSRAASRK